ncbi:MAG TPA: hypothetical protein VM427_01520 [Patescibacteria group bacterium]|nr:hypothetical protein [Patescibacteria group bacterium]
MAPDGAFALLSSAQVRRRIDKLTDFLADWGDLTVGDQGDRTERRLIEFSLESPGSDLPVDVKTRYREWYSRDAPRTWDLDKYTYEYLDVLHAKRLAFHLHDIGEQRRVFHAHCEDASEMGDEESPRHLRAMAYDLREAHERFMRLYASDERPDCISMLPLRIPRPDR